jgi:hypothetical protein
MPQPRDSAALSSPLYKLRLYCIGFGCLLTAILVLGVSRYLVDAKQARFDADADHLLDNVSTRLSASIAMTRSFRAFFEASDYVALDEFRVFATSSFQNFSYAAAALYAPRVQRDQRALFERQGTGAKIVAIDDSSGLHDRAEQADYFPILYLETRPDSTHADAGQRYRGIDLQATWKDVIRESVMRDEVGAAPSLTPGGTALFTLLVPVYEKSRVSDTSDQVQGLIATVIDTPLLVDATATSSGAMLSIAFSAGEPGERGRSAPTNTSAG